ncbi:hypothetical protein Adt_32601 [Abeliophyllum distichum]|uniref:Uncharacterized protein n=1 Tax=Abeliophyllum distichum TaxID=126358 RepID=A0ABD1QTX3_9LAMI
MCLASGDEIAPAVVSTLHVVLTSTHTAHAKSTLFAAAQREVSGLSSHLATGESGFIKTRRLGFDAVYPSLPSAANYLIIHLYLVDEAKLIGPKLRLRLLDSKCIDDLLLRINKK